MSMKLEIPYGRGTLPFEWPDDKVRAVLIPKGGEADPNRDETAIIEAALAHPIGSPRLSELAQGKRKVLVITSDHTRPVPSDRTLPPLLAEIRRGNPDAEITILVATGMHRATTREEMVGKFGAELVAKEHFVVHNSFDQSQMVYKGTLPSGCEFSVNRLADEADLVVSDGFIEPHFFAGFSGGRKSILPGITSAVSVTSNHCARLVAHERARTGILEGNPIHEDMVFAARKAGLAFILNVVIDEHQRVTHAFAGDLEAAHAAGCALVGEHSRVDAVVSDIAVTSNGGYPLDQNVYQSVKSMTAAEACCRKGGVIICASRCEDGSGGEIFVDWFKRCNGPQDVLDQIMRVPDKETGPDQWQSQVLARVMLHATVILVSDERCKPICEDIGIRWAPDIMTAMAMAVELKPDYDAVTVIPNGISVIVQADR